MSSHLFPSEKLFKGLLGTIEIFVILILFGGMWEFRKLLRSRNRERTEFVARNGGVIDLEENSVATDNSTLFRTLPSDKALLTSMENAYLPPYDGFTLPEYKLSKGSVIEE
ncbi:hypothetical protein G9A89_010026 [Geosiphon pyriformis]|nr:hypothetical protein G9A89_010026 [Geosiphon pyriformis]